MNWGTKLLIGMGIFIGFILVLSIKMIYSKTDDLVEKDYYEKGQAYDSDFKKQENAQNQKQLPSISSNTEGISIQFQETARYEISCKHPFDSSEDLELSGTATRGIPVHIAIKQKGNWSLEITWTSRGIDQKLKQQVLIR